MDETFTPPANTRFTDYPFREANLPSDQLEWLAKRNRAIKLYRENDNSSLAEEIGLFWNKEDEEYESIFNVGQKVRIEKAITDFKADFHPMD